MFYLYIFSAIAAILVFGSVLLYFLKKLFRLPEVTFRKSLSLTIAPALIALIIGALLALWNIVIANLAIIVITIVVFIYLIRKYYPISLSKAVGLFVVNGLILAILAPILLVVPFRKYVMEPFVVSGSSMEPNYHMYDYLFVRKFDMDLKRGEVIVYRSPKDDKSFFIHRIVGLPGEKVEFNSGKVMVNGTELDESYVQGSTYPQDPAYASLNLGASDYYVLADNRMNASDSRAFGTIRKSNIQGVVYKNFGKSPFKF